MVSKDTHNRTFPAEGRYINCLIIANPAIWASKKLSLCPPGADVSSEIQQILDIKEQLQRVEVCTAEACGMYRFLCVEGIAAQLRKTQIDYPHDEKDKARSARLDGYSIEVDILEELCI